jgi:hypothetical protein
MVAFVAEFEDDSMPVNATFGIKGRFVLAGFMDKGRVANLAALGRTGNYLNVASVGNTVTDADVFALFLEALNLEAFPLARLAKAL